MTSVLRRALQPVAQPVRRALVPATGLVRRALASPAGPPPRAAPVRPGTETFRAGDGRTGVLLVHGLTGSPWSLRGWAEHLAGAGFRVAVPRLPGHGTSWQELNQTAWTDWYAVVEREFHRLRDDCDQVFAGGLSMGGSLVLRLAVRYGSELGGLVLVNPFVSSADPRMPILPLLRLVTGSTAGVINDIALPGQDERGYTRLPLHALASLTRLWAELQPALGTVEQPLLLYRSSVDHVIDRSSARMILERVSSSDLTEIVLERSYHVATMDHDAGLIFEGSTGFFRRLAGG